MSRSQLILHTCESCLGSVWNFHVSLWLSFMTLYPCCQLTLCNRHFNVTLDDCNVPWYCASSPVYTIQPVVKLVVKPVLQPVVSCIQTFNRLSTTVMTTGCIVYTAGCQTGCTTLFDYRLNEQWLFVQHCCQTSCQTGCQSGLTTGLTTGCIV